MNSHRFSKNCAEISSCSREPNIVFISCSIYLTENIHQVWALSMVKVYLTHKINYWHVEVKCKVLLI